MYKIVWGFNIRELTFNVEKAMSEGWKLAGGVSVCRVSGNNEIRYYQAMSRSEDGEK